VCEVPTPCQAPWLRWVSPQAALTRAGSDAGSCLLVEVRSDVGLFPLTPYTLPRGYGVRYDHGEW